MHRLAVSMLCAALAFAAFAAPAPLYKPRCMPWLGIAGWSAPIDPGGDCKFERQGGTLTITVPGRGHGFDSPNGVLHAPLLLREVEGDYVAEVRVAGEYDWDRGHERRAAGFIFTGGGKSARLGRSSGWVHPILVEWPFEDERRGGLVRPAISNLKGYPMPDYPAYRLRLTRKGRHVTMEFRSEGRQRRGRVSTLGLLDPPWTVVATLEMPGRGRLGVFAESTVEGKFTAVFNQFELTPLK